MVNIPSWIVAAIGASLVILGTIWNYFYVSSLDEKLRDTGDELTKNKNELSSLWDNYKLSEFRKLFADIFVTQLQTDNPAKKFLLDNVANYLMGALLAMYTATDLEPPTVEPGDINLLRQNDVSAYGRINAKIQSLQPEFMRAVKARKSKIDSLTTMKDCLDLKKKKSEKIYMSLNILGLIIVLMKDLPIWIN